MLKVSNEKVCADHRDISATCLSIDDNQSIVALAGKQSIYLINVDQPNDIVCSIARHSKWDPQSSDFHPKQKIFYALSSNNNVEIYSFEQFKNKNANYNYHSYNSPYKFQTNYEDELDGQVNGDHSRNATFILRAHTRTITDLNWCPFSYDLLATSSIDSFIHIWDCRDCKKPNLSLTSVAGANQVKWNKIDEHLIATSHEVDARIWDIRKGNSPLHYIAAHLQKIYGIDWHPSLSTELATCSQDNTVKFWNLDVIKNKAESYINTNNRPVWRAKYTPLANGLITSQIKQNLDNSLWLWNTNVLDKPVYSFVAPQDLVIDFHFRTNRSQLSNVNEQTYYKPKYNDLREDFNNFDHDMELENDENLNSSNHSPANNNRNKTTQPHVTFEVISWSKDNKLRVWDLGNESLPVIDCDINQLIRYTNRYLHDKFKQKSVISGDYIKNLIKNDKKDSLVYNENETMTVSDKNGIKINYSSSNPFTRLSQKYSSSNSDLKELSQTNTSNKKTRKSSMAIPFISPNISPTDLKQEFKLIDTSNLKNLKIEEMNAFKRFCVIQAKSMYNSFVYRLKIVFPVNYPNNIAPTFFFLDGNNKGFDLSSLRNFSVDERVSKSIDADFDQPKLTQKEQKLYQETKLLLLNTLQNTAHMQVKRNRPCLEPCLKEFMAQIDEQPNTININVNDTLYGSFHDGNIPFPKTCGARFCGPNLLICYSRPISMISSKLTLNKDKEKDKDKEKEKEKENENRLEISKEKVTPTPKALSALSHYLNSSKKLNSSNTSSSQGHLNRNSEALPQILPISVSMFYTSNRSNSSMGKIRHKSAKNKPVRNPNWKSLPVYVYNVEKILPCSKHLAENYIFDANPAKMCAYNAEVAARCGKKDHLNSWSICKLISDSNVNQTNNDSSLMEFPWPIHPFARSLIDNLIDYYLSVRDIQMAAMLVCCFSSACLNCKRFSCSGKNCQIFSQVNVQHQPDKKPKMSSQPIKSSTNSSPYHTIGASAVTEQQNKSIFDRLTFNNNNNSSFASKDLQTQLKSYDIISNVRRNRSNSWSDIAETNGSLSDLTVIDSTCSIYGSVNSPNNNFRSIGGGSYVNNVFNLDQCASCQPTDDTEDKKEIVENYFDHIKSNNEELIKRDNDLHILNASRQFQFDCVKQIYADLLFSWKLFDTRCNVLNYVKIDNNYQKINQFILDYSNQCQSCNEPIRNSSQCKNCKRLVMDCSVCHIKVKGLAVLCLHCGHGGHPDHLDSWFKESKYCATGCGCYCEYENSILRANN